MPTTFRRTDTDSDLGGGADFNKAILLPASDTTGPQNIALGNQETRTSRAFTAAGVPGTDGVTGDYMVEMAVATGNADVALSVTLHRINSAGTIQASSATSAEQSATAGVKTFNFTSVDLGTWASGDRLRVDYTYRNTAHGSQNFDAAHGGTDNEVTAPWTTSGNQFTETLSTSITASSTVAAVLSAADTLVTSIVASTTAAAALSASDTLATSIVATTTLIDLPYYQVFRRSPQTGAVFDPGVDTPLATYHSSPYVDENVPDGDYDYQVFGYDGTYTSGSSVEQVTVAAGGTSFSETLSTSITASTTTTDVVTGAETLATTVAATTTSADSLNAAETLATSGTATTTALDSLNTAEALQTSVTASTTAADTLNASETLSTSIAATTTADDVLQGAGQFAESLSTSITATTATQDALSAAETLSVAPAATTTSSDTLGATEALSTPIAATTTSGDVLQGGGAFAETLATSITATTATADTAAFTDTLATTGVVTTTAGDGYGVTESLQVSITATTTAGDLIRWAETLTTTGAVSTTAGDVLAATETLATSILATTTSVDAAINEAIHIETAVGSSIGVESDGAVTAVETAGTTRTFIEGA